jgi:hypothetical protein
LLSKSHDFITDVFKFDAEYETNEEKYAQLRKELLDESDGSGSDGDDSGSGSEESDDGKCPNNAVCRSKGLIIPLQQKEKKRVKLPKPSLTTRKPTWWHFAGRSTLPSLPVLTLRSALTNY